VLPREFYDIVSVRVFDIVNINFLYFDVATERSVRYKNFIGGAGAGSVEKTIFELWHAPSSVNCHADRRAWWCAAVGCAWPP
jgi:hypothetical protein